MQSFFYNNGREVIKKSIPNKDTVLYKSLTWGEVDKLFTPAFWLSQVMMHEMDKDDYFYKVGDSFEEEVIVCLLGGFGIKEELCLAAFHALKNHGIIENIQLYSMNDIRDVLLHKIFINNKHVTYRYYNKKSEYIYKALTKLKGDSLNLDDLSDLELRDYLTTFPGIGLKTASWVVRNYLDSNNVAILDIHIYRAGILAGFFNLNDSIEKNYLLMEKKFLEFAKAINVKASILDVLIWSKIRMLNTLVIENVNNKKELTLI